MGCLFVIMVLLYSLNYKTPFGYSAMSYMLFGLVLSISILILLFRRFNISTGNAIGVRVAVIVGAVFCGCMWVILVYPVVWLFNDL